MSTATESTAAESTTLAALIIELDGVAMNVRAALYEAASALLGSAINPALFARYGLAATVPAMAEGLAKGLQKTDRTEELTAAMNDRLGRFLASEAKLASGVEKLIKAAAHRGIPSALITALPEEPVRAALDRIGVLASGVRLLAMKEEEAGAFPRADNWFKAAKGLGKAARFCVAVASSQLSAKTALAAGMRCVVVPDAFTSHHDFSGADLILDAWDDVSTAELLDAVVPMVR